MSLPRMRGDPPLLSLFLKLIVKSTPHARGSTPSVVLSSPCGGVYPACAGIHRHTKWRRRKKNGLPRMRGDPPFIRADLVDRAMSTPHARGSTHTVMAIYSSSQVYPACGDPPFRFKLDSEFRKSTPHARGSTLVGRAKTDGTSVYPACAGIHLSPAQPLRHGAGLPRMRGDPPISRASEYFLTTSTPHARGSTLS